MLDALRRRVAAFIAPRDEPGPVLVFRSRRSTVLPAPVPLPVQPETMNKQMLVTLAEAYAAHRDLKLSTVSTYVAADGKFFGNLKKQAGCTLARADRVLGWFNANWPADLEWPRHIPRPKKKEAA